MSSIVPIKLKDGKRRYKARVRVAGFPDVSTTHDSKSLAASWATQLESDMRSGRYQSVALAKKYTAGDVIDRYIERVLPHKSKKKRYIEQQEKQLLWWKSEIGQHLMINVTPLLLSDKRDLLANTREAGTVNRYLDALSHALTTTKKEWGIISTNPMESVSRLPEPRGIVRFLSTEEIPALLSECLKVKKKPLYHLVVLAICTGARKSELLNLKWRDIDFSRSRAVVQETKNNERRGLPFSQPAMDVVRDLYDRRHPRSEYMFAARFGNKPMNIEREWKAARERAGITDFRFHDLRHTAASYLAMDGATPSDIADAIGHKNLNMVKRYAHLSDTHTAAVIASMNEKIFNITSKESPHEE